ncbi:MAG: biotin/lipoyl-containing protein, partial [Solirubrobacteraceae bacterium]
MERSGVRPPVDAPPQPVLRPSGHRRRRGGSVHGPPGEGAERSPAGAAVSPAASGSAEVRVPDIGDFTDVPVIEIHVSAGDAVSPEDPLVTLESDKATMDVPAPFGGTVRQLQVKIGDRV